jgi:TonB family protein
LPAGKAQHPELLPAVTSPLLCLALLVAVAHPAAADKPTVYNHVTEESAELDVWVKAALEPGFTIVDVQDSPDYVPPTVAEGRLPCLASTPEGEPLGGDVLVAFVVSTEGRVISPVVLDSTDERLDAIATKAMEAWRLHPATLKGVAVAVTAAQEFSFETTPTEFVTQVLEPTGGSIPRPKAWFYAEGHGGPTYLWTLSREDTSGGQGYTTGVRIQVFTGVKEGTGKSARQFMVDFLEAKKQEATKVIKSCDAEDQGLFTRMCLETEEGPDHILYSVFWGSRDLDLAAVVIAGTTTELWSTYAPAFDRMHALELIDMKRFEK